MENKEIREKLNKLLTDYFFDKLTTRKTLKDFSESEVEESITRKKISTQYSKLVNIQNKPSDVQYGSGYTKQLKRAINQYMKLGIIINANPSKKCYKEEFEKGYKIVDKLISRCARLEADSFENYLKTHPDIDIDEIFNNEAFYIAYFSMDLIEIINNILVPESIRDKIKKIIPKDPKDEYPETRKMKRHFIIHEGLTNTGKTYHSLQCLKEATSGVYLGPLRLLALEVQETLNDAGVPCSLLTGEEENIIEGAKHISSTVEKLDINKSYDICVIDECQLVSDKERGCSWSRAILGVRAPEIHLALAPEGLNIIVKMIESCNDTYEIIHHERKTKLTFDHSNFSILRDIEQGDALIVFSRKQALLLGDFLTKNKVSTSIIYGALPYGARKKQLERFINGETQVVVSTDAIGMGLNLPIRRIIFIEQKKFDGVEMRELIPPEIKQIAGRAGRMGIYPEGFVLSTANSKLIRNGLNTKNEDVEKSYIGFSDEIASIDGDLIKILKVWKSIPATNNYRKMDITRFINLDIILKAILTETKRNISKDIELKFLNIPFDENNIEVLNLWIKYIKDYLHGKKIKIPVNKGEALYNWETYYKLLDLYYSFSKNFYGDFDKENLNILKSKTTSKINEILLSSLDSHGKSTKMLFKQ